MDCKDLMVGDWVSYKDDPPYMVRGTSICKVVTIDNGIDHRNVMDDAINPIPLTEDILVKNGFVFNKGYAVLQVSEDTYLDFYKHEHRLRKVWKGIDEWNNHAKVRDVTFVCQCYYVHEFQHALRLCGVEKSIIL